MGQIQYSISLFKESRLPDSITPVPQWLGEKLLHILQCFPLGLWQGEKEPDEGKEGPASIEVVSTKVKTLDQVQEGVWYYDVEGPVEPSWEADPCTSEPKRIDLKVCYTWDEKQITNNLWVDDPWYGTKTRLEADQVEHQANHNHGGELGGAVLGHKL